jgi:3-dehydroquinate synthase
MVGAFHQPKLVYMNVNTLNTLTDEQFSCGMGEILKHGLIRDADYYEWTIQHMSEICERDLATLKTMIAASCEIKRAVVEKDPTEKGERALLNFGHTIGHAIEKLKNFQMLHGQCVGLGVVAAAYISYKRELLSAEEFFEIRDMNVGFDLPISFEGLDTEEIIRTTKSDKKMEAGKIKFVLLKGIGHAFVDRTVTDDEMRDALNYLNLDLHQMD